MIRDWRRHARAFRDDTRGSILLLAVGMIVVTVGVAGLVVDVGLAYREKNVLLTSAEAAALAASSYIQKSDRTGALAVAQSYASRNRSNVSNLVNASGLEFGVWDKGAFTTGGNANAVRVTVARSATRQNSLATSFALLFGLTGWDVSASAIAQLDTPICILLLHPNHYDAFDIDPGAQIDAPGCAVQVNSSDNEALEISSSAYVNLKSLRVTGGVDMRSGANVTPKPVTGVPTVPDPYASLTPPVNNACGGAKSINGVTVTINPNLAFCNGLVIENATVTFSPGVYVIKNEFTLKSGATIKGDGVLIYLEGQGSDLFFYSNTNFELKAATTGAYAGIVLWSDRSNTKDHDIYSKFGARAEGTIYAPSSQIEFENKVVWEATCIRIVAARLELDNDSKYHAPNPSANCSNNILGSSARLVR